LLMVPKFAGFPLPVATAREVPGLSTP
jgi:hypothetical protein